jgi:hypothetical protein
MLHVLERSEPWLIFDPVCGAKAHTQQQRGCSAEHNFLEPADPGPGLRLICGRRERARTLDGQLSTAGALSGLICSVIGKYFEKSTLPEIQTEIKFTARKS